MSDRRVTTELLSALVEKRLRSRRMFWAPEVCFDKGMPQSRRIDFVGFTPRRPNIVTDMTSVELGTFECYEVKSCMADFTSGNGLTFYGDRNYLVTTREFAEKLRSDALLTPREIDGILVPDKPGDKLIFAAKLNTGQSYRRRVASEMLWQIVQARHHYDIEGATHE